MLDSPSQSPSTYQRPTIPPLRVLVAVASPANLARFDADQAWNHLCETLRPLLERGSIELLRVAPATEAVLRSCLDAGPWHVLHFIGHGRGQALAHYGAVVLENAEGRARGLNGRYFANTVRSSASLRLVVLQNAGDADTDFAPVCEALIGEGVSAAIATGPMSDRAQALFLAKLYSAILLQFDAQAALVEARHALAATGFDIQRLHLASRDPAATLFAGRPADCPKDRDVAPAPVPAPAAAAAGRGDGSAAAVELAMQLERKRAACEYDVFLCHNTADKPGVKRIGQWLKTQGILPWLDIWELPPGRAWQPILEKQIDSISTAAVFVGAAGVGPWQQQELYGFLGAFVSRQCPVIPVLLADAPVAPILPVFLRAMTWVDFRVEDPDPCRQLLWGITGQQPA